MCECVCVFVVLVSAASIEAEAHAACSILRKQSEKPVAKIPHTDSVHHYFQASLSDLSGPTTKHGRRKCVTALVGGALQQFPVRAFHEFSFVSGGNRICTLTCEQWPWEPVRARDCGDWRQMGAFSVKHTLAQWTSDSGQSGDNSSWEEICVYVSVCFCGVSAERSIKKVKTGCRFMQFSQTKVDCRNLKEVWVGNILRDAEFADCTQWNQAIENYGV